MGKKIIFLHIGNHKTGTSSLQFFLNKKKKFLLKKKILYLTKNDSTNHHNLSWQAIRHFYFNKSKQNINDILDEINKNKNFNILISSENFETLNFTKEFHIFIKKVKKTHKLKIIWTIREQFSYLISLLSMLINKGAFINNFEDLVDKIIKSGKLKFEPYIFWFNYIQQYEKIRKVFKIYKKDIILILYSKKNNIFKDFCRGISIKTNVNPMFHNKNVSKYFFNNKQNLLNMSKYFLSNDKKFFNKNIIKNTNFLSNKIFFKKNEILIYKQIMIDSYKSSNNNLMKLFKKKTIEKVRFYEN